MQFLEEAGHEFVSQAQKNQVFAVLDIDGNRKISLIEYLLYMYKPDILVVSELSLLVYVC